MDWLFDRLKEKSTWVAIITVITGAIGVAISPEHAELIAQAALGVTTAALVLIRERA